MERGKGLIERFATLGADGIDDHADVTPLAPVVPRRIQPRQVRFPTVEPPPFVIAFKRGGSEDLFEKAVHFATTADCTQPGHKEGLACPPFPCLTNHFPERQDFARGQFEIGSGISRRQDHADPASSLRDQTHPFSSSEKRGWHGSLRFPPVSTEADGKAAGRAVKGRRIPQSYPLAGRYVISKDQIELHISRNRIARTDAL